MTVLLATLVDSTIVLAIGLIAAAVLRRRSAALRHAILATAIVTASLMPAFELVLPQLPVIRPRGPVTVISSAVVPVVDDATTGFGSATAATVAAQGGIPWASAFVVVWMLGALVTGAGLMTALMKLRRLRARCTPVTGLWRELTDELSGQCGVRRRVALLQSDDPSLLVACGVRNPRIILPVGVSAWDADRARVVLRHELAHIGRGDSSIQIAGEILRVLLWVNPLVWVACRRLRQESEYACDDAVLNGGVEPTEYAAHLLDVATQLSGRRTAWAPVPAIAHPSTLERRITAMLHAQQNRMPVGRRGWSVAALVAIGIGVPLAAAGVAPVERSAAAHSEVRIEGVVPETASRGTNVEMPEVVAPSRAPVPMTTSAVRTREAAVAAQASATIAGTVLDRTGGTMPGAEVTLTDTRTATRRVLHTSALGRFTFGDLQPARYELVVRIPGFAPVSNVLTLASGAAIERTITLSLGAIQETVTLVCQAAGAANGARPSRPGARLALVARSIGASVFAVLSAQTPPAAAPVRVGGGVRPPRKLTNVTPVCPSVVPSTDTVVRLNARIGVDGFTNDVRAVEDGPGAEPPAALTESALDAVRQWTFAPALLNGRPVEADITVLVTFRSS